jgi:hypothetical protein
MPVPLYGFLQGDTVGLLILAEDDDTIQSLAQKLQDGANLRVAKREHVHVVHNEKQIDPTITIAEAGFQALDRFDVIGGQQ